MAILDGEIVKDDIINPKQHQFIGMFRMPFVLKSNGYLSCNCGQILQTRETCLNHWLAGHWDEPQYITIQKDKGK